MVFNQSKNLYKLSLKNLEWRTAKLKFENIEEGFWPDWAKIVYIGNDRIFVCGGSKYDYVYQKATYILDTISGQIFP